MALLKNTTYSIFNFGIKAFCNVIVFGILARVVGTANFGLMNYLITVSTIIVAISTFGYRLQIVKEVALNHNQVDAEYIVPKVVNSVFVFLICMIFTTILINNLYTTTSKFNLYLFTLISIFATLSGLFFSFFHALNKFHLETIALTIFSVCQIIGLYFSWVSGHLRYFALSYGMGALFMCLFCLFHFYKNFRISFKNSQYIITKEKLLKSAKSALPFAIVSYGDILILSLDILILQVLVSSYDAGVYSAASKITIGLTMPASILYMSVMPYACKFYSLKDSSYIKRMIQLFFGTVFFGTFIAVIYLIFHKQVNNFFFGEDFGFETSLKLSSFKLPISILLILRFAIIIPAMMIIAAGEESKRAIYLIGIVALNLIGYYVFIPYFGALGAFWVSIAFNLLTLISYMFIVLHKFKDLRQIINS
jgi:O-antigen/teichoic acid export membrane protein